MRVDNGHILVDTIVHFDEDGDCTCACIECFDVVDDVCICPDCEHNDCGS